MSLTHVSPLCLTSICPLPVVHGLIYKAQEISLLLSSKSLILSIKSEVLLPNVCGSYITFIIIIIILTQLHSETKLKNCTVFNLYLYCKDTKFSRNRNSHNFCRLIRKTVRYTCKHIIDTGHWRCLWTEHVDTDALKLLFKSQKAVTILSQWILILGDPDGLA